VSRGWFSIERIGFLARSWLVTFVAQVMIVERTQAFIRLIVLVPRNVEDRLRDFGRLFGLHALDGGESAEELIGDIGENGGTASGNAILRLEDDELGEEVVDAVEAIEVFGIFDEFGSEVGGLHIFGKSGVTRAETGIRVGNEFAAASAIGEAMLTAVGIIDRERGRCLLGLGRRNVVEFWLIDRSLRVHFFLDWGESKKTSPLEFVRF
jgi:hypothetical protein